ncbi:MAG: hypothetical protein WBA22_00135 [Candidatus Methanofastidiosia archaeon]
MTKRHTSNIHLHLSHILNKYPDIPESYILNKTSMIKSRRALRATLVHMEEERIILNPYLYVRNCEGYSNHYLIAEVKSWKDLYERIICRNWEAIDSAFYIRSWKRSRLAYIKYHNTLGKEVPDILEQGPIEYAFVLHPHSLRDDKLELSNGEPEKVCISPDRLNKEFDWDYDTNQVFRWLSINYRLSLTWIARNLGISRTTVKGKKRLIEEFTQIYYPTFIHSCPNYTRILSSFRTEYSGYLREVFGHLSATCYLFGNQDRTLLALNTTRPGFAVGFLEKLEERAIIEDLNTEIVAKSWNRIEDEYNMGRIPERLFWMFKGRIKKKEVK